LQKQDTLNKTGKTKIKTKQNKKVDDTPKKKLTYKQQQELNKLPKKIEKTEIEIAEIQLKLSDPEFFQRDVSQDALIRLSRLEAFI
jgi:ATP-binding cassette subfamily F protein uup